MIRLPETSIEHFKKHQDGLLYDIDMVFPGPALKDFKLLLSAIDFE